MNPDSRNIFKLNEAVVIIERREAVIRLLERDLYEQGAALFYVRGNLHALLNLLEECQQMLKLAAQLSTDIEAAGAVAALIERIDYARDMVQDDERLGRGKQRRSARRL